MPYILSACNLTHTYEKEISTMKQLGYARHSSSTFLTLRWTNKHASGTLYMPGVILTTLLTQGEGNSHALSHQNVQGSILVQLHSHIGISNIPAMSAWYIYQVWLKLMFTFILGKKMNIYLMPSIAWYFSSRSLLTSPWNDTSITKCLIFVRYYSSIIYSLIGEENRLANNTWYCQALF